LLCNIRRVRYLPTYKELFAITKRRNKERDSHQTVDVPDLPIFCIKKWMKSVITQYSYVFISGCAMLSNALSRATIGNQGIEYLS
jgi:hypothetical protein